MLINKDLLIFLTIRNMQVWKSLLINTEFNMEISL